MTLYLLSEFI